VTSSTMPVTSPPTRPVLWGAKPYCTLF